MHNILKVLSFAGLALTVIPGILVLKGVISINLHYTLMIAGMLMWFATAPFWMHGPTLDDSGQDKN